jgi:hypothetical protein
MTEFQTGLGVGLIIGIFIGFFILGAAIAWREENEKKQ